MRPTFLAAFPALALVAQAPAPAPAPVDYVKTFNTELPGVNQLLKSLKAKEAMEKAGSLVPAQRPAFDGTSLATVAGSIDQARGYLSLYSLWGSAAGEAGQWEKAVEIQQKRLQMAQGVRDDFAKAQAGIQGVWDKAVTDGKAYIAANQPRQAELEAKVKAFETEFAAMQADQKSGAKPHTKQEIDDINARGKLIPEQKQEIARIANTIKMHQDNQNKAQAVAKFLAERKADADGFVKAAEDALAKDKALVDSQAKEIAEFNLHQRAKKVKVVGNRTWANAVLREHENLTKLGSAQAQAAFLNRLLVVDPGNPEGQHILQNLTEGKDPFAKAAPKKGRGRRK